jgi:uncharacterized protein
MKKILGGFICLALTTVIGHAQNLYFNEIHYDNAGTDTGEFIEFAIDSALDVSMVSVELYNGANSTVYTTTLGSAFTLGTTVDGISFYSFTYPTDGIQNGAPDGMALGYGGTLVPGQFLSYEGTFTGSGGLADGVMSTDIGVSETSSTAAGTSLGLNGTGRNYSDFSWAGPITATPGDVNDGQEISAVPEPGTWLLLGLGAGLLGVVQRFRRKNI